MLFYLPQNCGTYRWWVMLTVIWWLIVGGPCFVLYWPCFEYAGLSQKPLTGLYTVWAVHSTVYNIDQDAVVDAEVIEGSSICYNIACEAHVISLKPYPFLQKWSHSYFRSFLRETNWFYHCHCPACMPRGNLSVVTMKIARSQHLGIWTTHKHNQSVEISRTHSWMCFESFGTVRERHK